MKRKLLPLLLTGFMALIFMASCTVPQDITYLQNMENGSTIEMPAMLDLKARPNDKLAITVYSKDGVLADLFNLTNKGGTTSNSNNRTNFYTVNQQGDIDFPVLGNIHIEGMNREEITGYIKNRLIREGLLNDPIVTMEFLNTGFSVLGEVKSPGRFDISNDDITILQAISMAGDLTINGMRENVLVLRQENGNQVAYRINLTDANSIYSSPAFYLQQNDVVYVEPDNMKKRSTTVNGNNLLSIPFWMSAASFLMSIVLLIVR